MLVSLNLRAPLVAVAPIADRLRDDLAWLPNLLSEEIGLSAGSAGAAASVVQVSRSDRDSARLSAFVQGIGYVVVATGPAVLGLTHDATTAWTVPVLIVLGTTASFTALGVWAAATQKRQRPA